MMAVADEQTRRRVRLRHARNVQCAVADEDGAVVVEDESVDVVHEKGGGGRRRSRSRRMRTRRRGRSWCKVGHRWWFESSY